MRTASLLLALPLLIASCGGSSDPDALTKSGESALGNQEWATAAGDFDAALKAIGEDSAHPMYMRASLGLAEAYADSSPTKSKEILLKLHKAMPGKLSAKDFSLVMDKMAASASDDNIVATSAVLAVALQSFPEAKASLDDLGKMLRKKADSSNNPEAKSALDSLGYIGGD